MGLRAPGWCSTGAPSRSPPTPDYAAKTEYDACLAPPSGWLALIYAPRWWHSARPMLAETLHRTWPIVALLLVAWATNTDAIGRLLSIEPRPDCVVITGDLADTGHPDEYAAMVKRIEAVN